MSRLFLDAVGDVVELRERAIAMVQKLNACEPFDLQLAGTSEEHGVNMATMVLYQWLLDHQQHGEFIQQVNDARCTVASGVALPELFIVPGLFYQHIASLGSDARLLTEVANRFGIKTTLVPTSSLGGVAENRRILQQFLETHGDRPYWLASISRGGAEIKWLMHEEEQAKYWQHCRGWVSVNGIVRGCRIFDRAGNCALWRLIYKAIAVANRINPIAVDEMQINCEQWKDTRLPVNTHYINVVSLPMSWDVSKPVQSRYEQLSPFGPNDGATILTDYLREPGLIYPVLGADHLMRDSQLSRVFYQLINRLLIDPTALPALAHSTMRS